MPRLPVVAKDNQWYPVNDITQRTLCELYRPFGNLTIKVYIYIIYTVISIDPHLGSLITYLFLLYVQVMYESTLPILLGKTNHGMEIPNGYSSVGLKQICDSQYEA